MPYNYGGLVNSQELSPSALVSDLFQRLRNEFRRLSPGIFGKATDGRRYG
jgi:hypothetical protein